MDNYKQKLFLLCALLVGCVLTSVATEFFTTVYEPLKVPAPKFSEQQPAQVPRLLKQNTQIGEPQQKIIDSKSKSLDLQSKNAEHKSHIIKQQQPNNASQNFKKQSPNMEQATAIININTATIAELDTLPGIGPAIANRIVEFRNQQPFTKIEDIMLVKGIGKKKFAKLRERITVE